MRTNPNSGSGGGNGLLCSSRARDRLQPLLQTMTEPSTRSRLNARAVQKQASAVDDLTVEVVGLHPPAYGEVHRSLNHQDQECCRSIFGVGDCGAIRP
jgi:pyridoxine 5'-phosphate synthase PdxJ